MIDKATVRRILDAADIVEVVSDYVNLQRRGANYMGLCPFHNERTPSFSVNRQRNICKCFSCGKGGSPVNFIMEKEGISYHDALLHLANKYGIKVEERELTDEERELQSERESMMIVNNWAMQQMADNLQSTAEGRNVGLEYLYQRGITANAIEKFKLGYAIDSSNDLTDKALSLGYDIKYLKAVGLSGESQQGKIYDRFKGRVIFPIFNPAGKVIAFGGRGIKGETAKYINSPESLIYHKSNELYGIYQAKNMIVKQDKCYLVEGYMDVISMWQSGIENTVASSGTSLTDGQIALIHRFTNNVTLVYDGDAAGIKASLRGIDLLLMHNLYIKVLLLPDGEDPDSFARKHTPEEFRQYILDNEKDFIKFKAQILLNDGASDPQKKSEAVRSIIKSLASISDLITRSLYIQECSRLMNVSEKILTSEVLKARNDVVNEYRIRREHAKLGHDNEDDNTSIKNDIDSREPVQNDNPKSDVNIINQPNNRLSSYEYNIIKYCVRYGMVVAVPWIDTEGKTVVLKVVEYVKEEMDIDNIVFTNPVYDEIFTRILSMIDDYDIHFQEYCKNLEEEYKVKFEQEVEEIACSQLSIKEIERKEEKLRESIEDEIKLKQTEFAQNYIGNILGSDANDNLRKVVLDCITDKYELSNIHKRITKVVPDIERVTELVPRAVIEWKDGIICAQRNDLQNQLKQAIANSDTDVVNSLMMRLQELAEIRKQLSPLMGDRILSSR